MPYETFQVQGKRGCTLKGIRTLPKKHPKAVIQIFHGMGEHKLRYVPFMEFMSLKGYACYAHDHRKQGESVTVENGYGLFERTDRWDDVLDDAYFVTRKILKDFPGAKIIILGHSMGSIVAQTFVANNALIPHAAIFMGTLPPMALRKTFMPRLLAGILGVFKRKHSRSDFLAKIVNKPLITSFGDNPRTPFEWLSHDESVVDAYVEDPLCGYAFTAKFYSEFIKAISVATSSRIISKTKDNPILFISGAEDPVGLNGEGVDEVYRLYSGHGFTQLTKKIVDGARHEILNETNKLETFDYLLKWCDKTLIE